MYEIDPYLIMFHVREQHEIFEKFSPFLLRF